MSRIFKDMYFKLFSVKPWSSFNVSGPSQPQTWQWLPSCSASSCPAVTLGTGGQILGSVRALAKFHQFTDGWGTDSQLQIWILVICDLTSNCFFSLFILPLHFLYTSLPCCTSALQSPGCCSGSQSSGAKNKPWKPLCPLQRTGNRVRKKDLLAFIFSLLCVNSLPKEHNTE